MLSHFTGQQDAGFHRRDCFRLIHVRRIPGNIKTTGQLVDQRVRQRHFARDRPARPCRRRCDIERLREVNPPFQASAFRIEQHAACPPLKQGYPGPAARMHKRIIVSTVKYQRIERFFATDRLENLA